MIPEYLTGEVHSNMVGILYADKRVLGSFLKYFFRSRTEEITHFWSTVQISLLDILQFCLLGHPHLAHYFISRPFLPVG